MRLSVGAALIAGAAALVLLAGCAGDDDGGAGENGGDLPAHFHEMLEQTSDYQREILEDGEVSDSEYERAVLATVACVEEHGWTIVQQPHWDDDGRMYWEFGGAFSLEESDRAAEDYDSCAWEYSDLVVYVWEHQAFGTWEDRLDDVSECLSTLGYDVSTAPEVNQLRSEAYHSGDWERLDEIQACVEG